MVPLAVKVSLVIAVINPKRYKKVNNVINRFALKNKKKEERKKTLDKHKMKQR